MRYFSLFLAFLLVSGCTTAQQKQSAQISKGVYQIQSAIKAGRFDLAKKYDDSLTLVVAKPKKVEVIQQVESKSVAIDVLPESEANKKITIDGSEDFKMILKADPILAKENTKEEAQVVTFEKKNQEVKAELLKPKTSWFGWVFKIFSGLGIFGILGLIVGCIFFPALIPLVFDFFKGIFGFFKNIINSILSLFTKK